ncbi:TonB-dependent siderophore receptor [Pseudoduganella sp. SL102]|uniref:TonB-dependent receptor n=1 Tax=Pseudoduganella sp. SL102 TaxID=2995154 RepID=UPI00248BF8DC|nr:TonB-dependent siderophore receptor [Pseudoduganella sp. SL102]WBS05789.1 TonB-dependent siderophore receptor [Pseudoduganella sp. SL102]
MRAALRPLALLIAGTLPAAASLAETTAATMPTVVVTAEGEGNEQVAKRGRAGLLGERDVLDQPFSIVSYTSQRMRDQQAVTLAEVLGGDSSARFTGQTGGVTDSFFLRGFPVNEGNLSEVALDGVYGVSPNYHLSTEYLERVEVLKGPGALLYGMSPNSGVGGVVNAVPKRSLHSDLTRLTFDYAADGQFGTAVDVSRRQGDFGIRFNALHRQGDTALDKQDARAEVAALALDYRGRRLRATLDLIGQYRKIDAPTRPFLVSPGLPVPAAPDGRRNVTQEWGWWRSSDVSTLGHVEYDLSDKVTVFADLGAAKSDVGRLSEQTPTILNAQGDTSAMPTHFKFQINRAAADVGLRAALRTGQVDHALVLMANAYHDRLANASNAGTIIRSSLYAPVAAAAQAVPEPARVPKLSESTLSSFAVADTLALFDGRLQATLGLRRQSVESENFNAATGLRTARYDETAVTPLAGVVFKATPRLSLYANHIQGLSKGDIAPNTASNAGQVFAPYKSRQVEIGAKSEVAGLLATLAAFQITKPSGQLYGTVYSPDSEQRNRGVELHLSGGAAPGVRLLGGVTLIDGELTRTNNPATLGRRPPGVARAMANLGGEWDAGPVTLTGALTYTGKEYVDQANLQSVPSWTRVDIGARCATVVAGRPVTLRAGLMNAFDRRYWGGVASYGTLSQAAPRTVQLSAAIDL